MLNEEEFDALKTLVNYTMDNEYKHYFESGEPREHIYIYAKILNDFINKNN